MKIYYDDSVCHRCFGGKKITATTDQHSIEITNKECLRCSLYICNLFISIYFSSSLSYLSPIWLIHWMKLNISLRTNDNCIQFRLNKSDNIDCLGFVERINKQNEEREKKGKKKKKFSCVVQLHILRYLNRCGFLFSFIDNNNNETIITVCNGIHCIVRTFCLH